MSMDSLYLSMRNAVCRISYFVIISSMKHTGLGLGYTHLRLVLSCESVRVRGVGGRLCGCGEDWRREEEGPCSVRSASVFFGTIHTERAFRDARAPSLPPPPRPLIERHDECRGYRGFRQGSEASSGKLPVCKFRHELRFFFQTHHRLFFLTCLCFLPPAACVDQYFRSLYAK